MRSGVRNKKAKEPREQPIAIEPGSGNVFADLALPNSEDLLAKVELVQRIIDIITGRKLTQARAAALLGIDQPALSRLETGHHKNPTLDTLWRYAAAVGRRLLLTTQAIRDTRPARGKAKRVRAARER